MAPRQQGDWLSGLPMKPRTGLPRGYPSLFLLGVVSLASDLEFLENKNLLLGEHQDIIADTLYRVTLHSDNDHELATSNRFC